MKLAHTQSIYLHFDDRAKATVANRRLRIENCWAFLLRLLCENTQSFPLKLRAALVLECEEPRMVTRGIAANAPVVFAATGCNDPVPGRSFTRWSPAPFTAHYYVNKKY